MSAAVLKQTTSIITYPPVINSNIIINSIIFINSIIIINSSYRTAPAVVVLCWRPLALWTLLPGPLVLWTLLPGPAFAASIPRYIITYFCIQMSFSTA
jgi:hypothetical protein